MSPTAPAAPLRLLYVEDDRVTALLFSEALRHEADVELRLADSPSDALALVAQWTPDVLVLDGHLPEMSGHELLARLRALPALGHVPAIMSSADHDAAAREQARAAGFDGYWVKPVPPAELRCNLRALAAQRNGASPGDTGSTGRAGA